ncbi:MAG: transcriptional regulator [Hyphomicrobiales bacterium]|nr:MAG: transcriptional regulator [Hyphomicrobiales bacterium]
MLSSNNSQLPHDDEVLNLVFRALGDQTRRALLARLVEGPAKVTDLAKQFEMSLPAVGKHIRVLENAGLVDREIKGRIHQCSLNAGPLKDAEKWLVVYQDFWNDTLDSLVRHLRENPEIKDRKDV